MGWANCGTDSEGRSIGYAFDATCDEPGCEEKINRGLTYACGGMHGETGYDCEKYFCDDHLFYCYYIPSDFLDIEQPICIECIKLLEEYNGG